MKRKRLKRKSILSVDAAMRDWGRLKLAEKERMYSYWEMAAGNRWEEEFSQLKVDELFDLLGGTELPRKIIHMRR